MTTPRKWWAEELPARRRAELRARVEKKARWAGPNVGQVEPGRLSQRVCREILALLDAYEEEVLPGLGG